MNNQFKDIILKATGATDLFELNQVQELWSGYGMIVRFGLKGSKHKTIIVKHISVPQEKDHPRGWNTNLSHARKLKSYEVEIAWYRQWSERCNDQCRVPQCLACESCDDEILIVLEDLNNSGYEQRHRSISIEQMKICLKWLAYFHATFMGEAPNDLWPVGTYWHLATRPDELKILTDKALKDAAQAIDNKLTNSSFKTFVHGDAKLANFCFSEDGKKVAAVDFQYVGGGCGMKDVAYFIGSCLHDEDCGQYENQLLENYFQSLNNALEINQSNIDIQSLEREWRELFPVAWTDFHRFIKGWSPGHWKINSYSEQLAQKTLEAL